MADINSWAGTGNLTRDPELRQTQGGQQVLQFSIACNESRKNQQTGQWEEVPNFIDCVVWGTRAEKLAQIMRKGMKVSLSGRLHYSKWQAKDGTNRSKLEVYASEVVLPPRVSKEAPQRPNTAPRQQSATSYQPQPQQPANAPSAPQINQAPIGYQQPYQQTLAAAKPAPQGDVYEEDIPFD